jgi:hypothetical protein
MHRLTIDQYHEMIDSGLLREDDRVELLEGWLVEKMPQDAPHSSTVHRLNKRLLRIVDEEYEVREQLPISTPDSEPEPDVAIVHGPEERYFDRQPVAGEIELTIEVADSSLEQDRRKAGIYASVNVPFYWIINLAERQIEVYSGPSARKAAYRHVDIYKPGDQLPLIIGGREVATFTVDELLPPVKKRRKPRSSA